MERNIFQRNLNPSNRNKTERANITFSVARVRRAFRKGNYAKIIRVGSAVYTAVVMEYLVAEILELAGNEAVHHKRKRIIPRHIMLAIRKDEDLNNLLESVVISNSGVVPHVHPTLTNVKKK